MMGDGWEINGECKRQLIKWQILWLKRHINETIWRWQFT